MNRHRRYTPDIDIDWRNWTVGVEWSSWVFVICVGPLLISWSERDD